jgi:hypothetical protein
MLCSVSGLRTQVFSLTFFSYSGMGAVDELHTRARARAAALSLFLVVFTLFIGHEGP